MNHFKKIAALLLFMFVDCLNAGRYDGIKVLVTGGCGFIGSHLVELLVAEGAQVSVIDNFSTGKRENLADIADRVRIIHSDITDASACIKASEGQDIIFHLAALTSVNESMIKPADYFRVNIQGTCNMLEAARINGVKRFVFSSSAAVYGNKDGVCSEDDSCAPTSPYGFSKLIGEQLCRQYCQCFGINSICLRYFNVYGPRQDPASEYAGVVSKFKECLHHNRPITIFGDGLQTRDFVPVAEIARANMMLGLLPAACMQAQPCNIATGKSINLHELIDMLAAQSNRAERPIIRYGPSREGDIRHSQADCSRLNMLMKMVD